MCFPFCLSIDSCFMTAVAKSMCLPWLNILFFSHLGITGKNVHFRIQVVCSIPGPLSYCLFVKIIRTIFSIRRPGDSLDNSEFSCPEISMSVMTVLLSVQTQFVILTYLPCLMYNIHICGAFIIQSQYLMHTTVTLIYPAELMTQNIDVNHSGL